MSVRPVAIARAMLYRVGGFWTRTFMAQLLIPDLDDDLRERLARRAREHGRSVEDEAQQILRNAVRPPNRMEATEGMGTRLANLFSGLNLTDEERSLFELPRQPVRPAAFD